MSSSEKEGYQSQVLGQSLLRNPGLWRQHFSFVLWALTILCLCHFPCIYHGIALSIVSFCTHLCLCFFFQATSYCITWIGPHIDANSSKKGHRRVEPAGIFAIVLLISEALSRSTKRLTGISFILGFSTFIINGQLTTLVADWELH
jgi:hypothetical protein